MPKRIPPEVIETIRALRAEGKTNAEIAEACGVSESTAFRYSADRPPAPAQRTERPKQADGVQQAEAVVPAREAPAAATKAEAPTSRVPHPHACDANPNAASQPRPLLSIRERGPGTRLRGLLVGAGEMVAALGGQVEIVVSVRRVEG